MLLGLLGDFFICIRKGKQAGRKHGRKERMKGGKQAGKERRLPEESQLYSGGL